MAMLYALVFPAAILTMTAVSVLLPDGLKGLNNAGPHGLSEILYAFSSTMIHGVGRDAAFIVRAIRERSALRAVAADRVSSSSENSRAHVA